MKKLLFMFVFFSRLAFAQSGFEDILFGTDISTFGDMSLVLEAKGVKYYRRVCEPLTGKYHFLREVRYSFDSNNKLYMIKLFCKDKYQRPLYSLAVDQKIPWIGQVGNKDIFKNESTVLNYDIAGDIAMLSIFDIGLIKHVNQVDLSEQ